VLRGAGETFCAGDDIKEFNAWKLEDALWQIRQYQETVNLAFPQNRGGMGYKE